MKKYILIAAILLFTLCAFNIPETIVGHWTITKVEHVNKKDVEQPSLWVEFSANGRIVRGKIGEKASSTGEWAYNEASNTLSFKAYKGAEGDGTYTVEKITENELVISKDGLTAYLTKSNK